MNNKYSNYVYLENNQSIDAMEINDLVISQRAFYTSGATRSYEFRFNALKKLKQAITDNSSLFEDALMADLNKPASETYICETGIILDEVNYHLKNLKKWMSNKRVPTPLTHFKSTSFISPEPYGVVLIMSPWNYPVQLCLSPLIGAISAGNCAIIKPSAYSPHSSKAVAKVISQVFSQEYIAVVEGGREENNSLLKEKYDYIFFTGSVAVGKLVMESASKHLTPVSLELGGKSPVIIDKSVNIEIAARRVVFGKILNAGQTCIAPDYVLVNRDVKAAFIEGCKKAFKQFFPTLDTSDMPVIINEKHYARVSRLLDSGKVVMGGGTDASRRYIDFTILDDVCFDSPIMQEEIFGPILPIISVETIDECIAFINSKPKPLALYLFTNDKVVEKNVLESCSFGGGCINDTIIHVANHNMAFGGVGNSGMGAYHGKFSFDTFTHYRSIVKKCIWPDIMMRYRPYTSTKDSIIKKLMK